MGDVRRIVWAALSVILLAGIVASLLIADSARKSGEAQATTAAREAVDDRLVPILEPEDLARPVTGAAYDRLRREVQDRVLYQDVTSLAILRSDGVVLFSTDRKLVGEKPEVDRDALRRASDGDPTSEVEGSVFRSWVPVRAKASGPVIAVAQIDRPYAPIWTAAVRPWRIGAIAMGAALLVALAFLLLTFRSGAVAEPPAKVVAAPQPEAQEASQPKADPTTKRAKGDDPGYTQPGFREALEARQQAEERAQAAEEQYRALQDQLKRALEELRAAEERAKAAEAGGAAQGPDPRVDQVMSRMEELQGQLRDAQERAEHAQQRAVAAEAALAAAPKAEAGADAAGAEELQRAEARAQEAERQLESLRERVADMEARLQETETQAERAKSEMAAVEQTAAKVQEVEVELRDALERAAAAEAAMAEADARARAAEERAADAENAGAQALTEADTKRVEAEARMAEADTARAEAQAVMAEAEAIKAEVDEQAARIKAQKAEIDEQRAELEAAAVGAQAAEQEALQLAKARATDAEQQLAGLQARLEEITAQLALAEERLSMAPEDDPERAELQTALEQALVRAKASSDRLLEMEERARAAERSLEELQTRATFGDERVAALDRALHGDELAPMPGEERRASVPFVEALTKDARASINSILGISLTAKHMRDPDDLQPLLRQLTSQARKLDSLVGDILQADRLAKGTVPLNRRRTDLDALVRRVLDELGVGAERDLRMHSERVSASVDPLRIEQVVSSLVSTSMARTSPGKPVYVRVESNGDDAVIAVEDDESPVPGDLSPIVIRFAELHGGRAEMSERMGGGTSFRVYVPGQQESQPDVSGNGQASADLADEDVTAPLQQE
jgi:archaellum component FlaC